MTHLCKWTALCLVLCITGCLTPVSRPDPRLTEFAKLKHHQTEQLATDLQLAIPTGVQEFFAAAERGDASAVTNIYESLRQRNGHTNYWESLCLPATNVLSVPLHETWGAYWEFLHWDRSLMQEYADRILQSLPPGSIYFGGTGPGRFVITALHDTANAPDVFIITQNALQDSGYTDYLRLIYGGNIWLPTAPDVQRANHDIDQEVASGRRPPSEGALRIWALREYLAKQIFDNNKSNHEVYVEQSFYMGDLDPFSEPHGLIMKVNPEPLERLDPKVIERDRQYWDALTKELLADPRFLHNETARWAYSKLRSSIASLYITHKQPRDAERAFQQARLLLPSNPEANFNFISGVLIPERRFDEALAIAEALVPGYDDPERLQEYLRQLRQLKNADERTQALEARRQQGTLDTATALELAGIYGRYRDDDRFMEIIDEVLSTTNLPPQIVYQVATLLYTAKQYPRMDDVLERFMTNFPASFPAELYLNIARMYSDAKMPLKMVSALQQYLKINPSDWKAWTDLSYVLLTVQKMDDAKEALEKARHFGGTEAEALIQKDDRFKPLLQTPAP